MKNNAALNFSIAPGKTIPWSVRLIRLIPMV